MILIVSNTRDNATVDPVCDALSKQGANYLLYFADSVAQGSKSLSYKIGKDGHESLRYDGKHIDISSIGAAWLRRPNYFSTELESTAKIIYYNQQRIESQRSIWDSIPEKAWLNNRLNVEAIKDKNKQLRIAKEQGFVIPKTVVSNDWDEIIDTFGAQEVILKMPSCGLVFEETVTKRHMTKTVSLKDLSALRKANPFPGYWQEYIPKKREWRVTMVGKDIFSAAIYTNDTSRDDWRKHQHDKALVTFKAGILPDTVKKQCHSFMKACGLRYGAIDIIETPSGEFVFLEVNSNGQYQWLVDQLGLDIPAAIASQLIAIHKANSK